MKRLDTAATYVLANLIFPDDGNLALFNFVLEVTDRDLPVELIDGPDDIIDHAETGISAVLAMATIGAQPCRINWGFDDDGPAQKDILLRMAPGLMPAAQPPGIREFSRPPLTVAALVACRSEDGRFAYGLFRHPEVEADQARAIIANLFPDGAAAPAADGKN